VSGSSALSLREKTDNRDDCPKQNEWLRDEQDERYEFFHAVIRGLFL
jgi:hypothetical protein